MCLLTTDMETKWPKKNSIVHYYILIKWKFRHKKWSVIEIEAAQEQLQS